MKALYSITPIVIILALIFTSCEPFEKISEVPEIHFKEYKLYDGIDTLDNPIKIGELVFTFVDGDADIGVNTKDEKNLFLLPYEKSDGVYDSIDAITYGREYSILYNEKLTRTGQNKTIKGEIKAVITYFFDQPFDTIKYDFYILDQSGHKSNIESTRDIAGSELVIRKQ